MADAMVDGRSTPRYALLFAVGIAIGSAARLTGWLLPSGFANRVADWLLE